MWKVLFMLRNFSWHFFRIVFFNFYFLPFKQAIKLPIWIVVRNPFREYKRGSILLDTDNVSPAMIRIGHRHDFYYHRGMSLKNEGTIVFKGKAVIGNETAIEVFPKAKLVFGQSVGISSSKIFCSSFISFGNRCSVGKECTFMDTDFHRVKNIKNASFGKVSRPIRIGDENWFGYQSLIMKGTEIPEKCIVSARSIVRGSYNVPPYSIIGMKQSAELWSTGYYMDPFDNAMSFDNDDV